MKFEYGQRRVGVKINGMDRKDKEREGTSIAQWSAIVGGKAERRPERWTHQEDRRGRVRIEDFGVTCMAW
jgi:hypothetical protein